MFSWALTFLAIAFVSAVLGFGAVAGAPIEAAKLVYFVAIILFLVTETLALIQDRKRAAA